MTILKPLLGQVFLCLSLTCYAQTYSVDVEKFKSTDNFIVHVNNPLASRLIFLLKDSDGKSVLQESFMFVEKIRKVFFLGSLQPGEYVIEVFNGQETKGSKIKVDGINKTVHPENGKVLIVGFSKPKTDNSVDIIVQNKLDKNVTLKIYKDNALLNNEDLGSSTEIIKKIFKLPKTDKGDFVIKVGTKENIYQYKLSI